MEICLSYPFPPSILGFQIVSRQIVNMGFKGKDGKEYTYPEIFLKKKERLELELRHTPADCATQHNYGKPQILTFESREFPLWI